MKTVKFFNKLQNSTDLQNIAATQINDNLKSFIESFTRNGFLTGYSETDYGFKIELPKFTKGFYPAGISNPDYLNASIADGNIFGINTLGNPLIIDTNEDYQTSDITQNGGNLNIPLTGGTKPYTNYIYIIYRQIQDKSKPYLDFDGNTNYPINNHGYYIIASNSYPYLNNGGLYCGSVTVNADLSQTYDYSNISIAGIRDSAIKIQVPGGSTPYVPSIYQSGIDSTLKDHISAIGTNVIDGVTIQNPHGISATDIDALEATTLCDTTNYGLFRNGLLSKTNTEYTTYNYEWQAKQQNTGTVSSIFVTGSDLQFIYNGTLHSITEIDNYSSDSVELIFPTGLTAGWYAIFITTNSNPNFPYRLSYVATDPSFFQADTDPNIYLGYTYLNASPYELRQYETGSSGSDKAILPFYTWGTINSKQLSSNLVNDYKGHSDNLLIYNKACAANNNACGKVNLTNSGITIFPLNTAFLQEFGDNGFGEKLSFNGNATATTNSVIISFATIPNKYNGDLLKPISSSIGKKIYTVYFTYIANRYLYSPTASFSEIKVTVNSRDYYLPIGDLTVAPLRRFMITTDTYPTVITFTTKFATADSGGIFSIGNIQVVEGHMMTDTLLDNAISTNKIMYNNEISLRDDGNGNLMAGPETRITKMNLDNLFDIFYYKKLSFHLLKI